MRADKRHFESILVTAIRIEIRIGLTFYHIESLHFYTSEKGNYFTLLAVYRMRFLKREAQRHLESLESKFIMSPNLSSSFLNIRDK